MKTVVVSFQHENWEDGGGAHDPKIVQISDEDFDMLARFRVLDLGDEDQEKLYDRLERGIIRNPQFPLQIDYARTVWYG